MLLSALTYTPSHPHPLITYHTHTTHSWSYQYTWGDNLVCDLQGVKGTTSFQLTDPAVHSKGQTYGMTDRGSRGMEDFWSTHQCNALCEALKLKMPKKNKKKTWRSKGGGRKVTEGHSMGAKEK